MPAVFLSGYSTSAISQRLVNYLPPVSPIEQIFQGMKTLVGPGDTVANSLVEIYPVSGKAVATVYEAGAGVAVKTLEISGDNGKIGSIHDVE